MAVGWAREGAVQEQIEATVEDAVQLVRSRLPEGESCKICQECGIEIPAARRKAVPGVRQCIQCQEEIEKHQKAVSYYNRSGNKDSQLK